MRRKGLLYIAMLFLCGTVNAERTIWYVHPDSTLNTIQVGLDSCADNDIVLVAPGTYVENIIWPNTQGIHLISELGAELTIIDGGGTETVIACTSSVDTTTMIRGFSVRNGYDAGILCAGASPTICDNVVTGNVCDSLYGYAVYVSEGAPIIIRNTVATNTGGGIGVSFGYGSTIIDTNIVESNTEIGIYVSHVFSACNNIVENNGSVGMDVYNCEHFTNNIISYNTGDGVVFPPGFLLNPDPIDSRKERSYGHNVISHNGGYGIGGFAAFGYKHSIIEFNGAGGILTYFLPSIDSCTITHNYGPGITVLGIVGSADLDTMHVHYCDIYGNVGYGILNVLDPDTFLINAENIWWGHATGPYHPTTNPGGLGDTVSDYVDFDPWLSWPVGVEEQPIVSPTEKHETLHATILNGPLQLPEGRKCKVFDITGRVVEPHRILPGIYFIEIGGVVTQKVVKVR